MARHSSFTRSCRPRHNERLSPKLEDKGQSLRRTSFTRPYCRFSAVREGRSKSDGLPAVSLYRPRRAAYRASMTVQPSDSILIVRSEEHTSELQSLMRISYAVFCL